MPKTKVKKKSDGEPMPLAQYRLILKNAVDNANVHRQGSINQYAIYHHIDKNHKSVLYIVLPPKWNEQNLTRTKRSDAIEAIEKRLPKDIPNLPPTLYLLHDEKESLIQNERDRKQSVEIRRQERSRREAETAGTDESLRRGMVQKMLVGGAEMGGYGGTGPLQFQDNLSSSDASPSNSPLQHAAIPSQTLPQHLHDQPHIQQPTLHRPPLTSQYPQPTLNDVLLNPAYVSLVPHIPPPVLTQILANPAYLAQIHQFNPSLLQILQLYVTRNPQIAQQARAIQNAAKVTSNPVGASGINGYGATGTSSTSQHPGTMNTVAPTIGKITQDVTDPESSMNLDGTATAGVPYLSFPTSLVQAGHAQGQGQGGATMFTDLIGESAGGTLEGLGEGLSRGFGEGLGGRTGSRLRRVSLQGSVQNDGGSDLDVSFGWGSGSVEGVTDSVTKNLGDLGWKNGKGKREAEDAGFLGTEAGMRLLTRAEPFAASEDNDRRQFVPPSRPVLRRPLHAPPFSQRNVFLTPHHLHTNPAVPHHPLRFPTPAKRPIHPQETLAIPPPPFQSTLPQTYLAGVPGTGTYANAGPVAGLTCEIIADMLGLGQSDLPGTALRNSDAIELVGKASVTVSTGGSDGGDLTQDGVEGSTISDGGWSAERRSANAVDVVLREQYTHGRHTARNGRSLRDGGQWGLSELGDPETEARHYRNTSRAFGGGMSGEGGLLVSRIPDDDFGRIVGGDTSHVGSSWFDVSAEAGGSGVPGCNSELVDNTKEGFTGVEYPSFGLALTATAAQHPYALPADSLNSAALAGDDDQPFSNDHPSGAALTLCRPVELEEIARSALAGVCGAVRGGAASGSGVGAGRGGDWD
ncbi:hypothetical protein HK097_003476 [Rhizophlyctis rosea]|uniref:Uncharacterized protein n=1 Tax=Rhizophlyctis rosea TaxID=64517 RepID=A0AAD5SEU1_9FUNG|nr:hypothetical protein HK097_003476 [Rhizophlyctis rosea]